MRLLLSFAFVLLLAPFLRAQEPIDADECTVGVACGRATADGRPLLWKNRDAHRPDNVVMALADGRIPYFALCDAGKAEAVWGGANAAGFGIVNAVSRDLAGGNDAGPGNGGFMKRALQECETVVQFEELLRQTNEGGRRTRANFGVIDAHGGAAFFEAGHRSYQRFDAADGESGVLVRTNFAQSGDGKVGRERCARAADLVALPTGKPLTTHFVLQQLLRDLQPPASAERGEAGHLDTRETICRQNTVAALVVHGVRKGDDPGWTAMWALLGPPLFTVAVPLFPAAGDLPPAIAGTPRSAICDAARALAEAHYETPSGVDGAADAEPEVEQAGPLRWLRTDRLAPTRRAILFAEVDIMARHEEALANWRTQSKPSPVHLRRYQEAMVKLAFERVASLADAQRAGAPAGK